MKQRPSFYLLTIFLFIGCGHRESLTCIVMGYDSIIYYHGSSAYMKGIKRGVVTDRVFTEELFHSVKKHGYLLTLKPGDGHDVMTNFQEMVNLANDHGVSARRVLAIDTNESKAFGSTTPEVIENAKDGKYEPMKLNLPRDEDNGDTTLNKYPKSAQLMVIIAGDDEVYAYPGGDMQKGKKYTYDGLANMLKTRVKVKLLFVALRPSGKCSYKNTVDVLDIMKIAGVEHYGLFDIKKAEEDYLYQMALIKSI